MTRPFRFGVNMTTPDVGEAWRARCVRAEALGYDVILVPDHLGMVAPFPALVAAAAATERPRLGTFVLNAAFWNPALLAREIATTDALTGGRLEVGLGAGYVREEHERAGLEFLPPGERVGHLIRTVTELDRLLGDEVELPRPVQLPRPPLLIGGNGDRVLRLAAEHAEIAAFTGGRATKEGGPRVLAARELAERVDAYRGFAAGRAVPAELNLLLQYVAVTPDRRAAVRELTPIAPELTEDELLDLPLIAVGTVRQIADQLRGLRERFGFSYLCVLAPFMEAFGPVIEELSGS
ncbi:TIGR03621 family F420-dependent LLM class oxidoreductase [Streptomyces scopuliridis]|uniref:TIGR03621 family F420-dependent LLM class oxidoreductase n=1 Tax=Streptomyces scopuliridis TaxID=452529 RepID=A0ACD4ZTH4_9ACTN|nr:TIGR03621 family F420-dependent LLM class oxidoreductase [Streptomyces scopuliridis]WSC01489.1 TIGR03621 family F420-dependent LLM class oxidoreductase [Streptomyces scopuliridis]WSC04974.1 TIGR03621 family F420-dependent LLM class oxidoreductase [Streptomyces scopuliridis]